MKAIAQRPGIFITVAFRKLAGQLKQRESPGYLAHGAKLDVQSERDYIFADGSPSARTFCHQRSWYAISSCDLDSVYK